MKEMTLKEMLLGKVLSDEAMRVYRRESGRRIVIRDGAFKSNIVISSDPYAETVTCRLHGTDYSLPCSDVDNPISWIALLKHHTELLVAISRLTLNPDIVSEFGKLPDLVECALDLNTCDWSRTYCHYAMAYSLSHYIMELIHSRKLQLPVNQKKSVWMTPSAILKVVTIDPKDTSDGEAYPMIRVIRYTSIGKAKFEMCLDSLDETTWETMIRRIILLVLSGEIKNVRLDFFNCFTSAICKASSAYKFCSSLDKEEVERNLAAYMANVRLPSHTGVKVPDWMILEASAAFNTGLPSIDMVGDLVNKPESNARIVAPCTIRHAPIYNKDEAEITHISNEACTWVTTISAGRM